MARTQEERKAETRTRLISAAADLFARKGFHAVSAEAVADAADRTTGALYSHFGGKEGLLLALLEVWKEQTVTDLLAEWDSLPGVDGQLRSLWTSIVGPDDSRGDAWLMLEMELWLHGVRDPSLGVLLAERFEDARARLADGLSDWADLAAVPLTMPSSQLAALIIGLLLGTAIQYRVDPTSVSGDAVVAALRHLLSLPEPESGVAP